MQQLNYKYNCILIGKSSNTQFRRISEKEVLRPVSVVITAGVKLCLEFEDFLCLCQH